MKNSIEATKISKILKTLALMENDVPKYKNIGKLEFVISQLTTKYLYNESVTGESYESLFARGRLCNTSPKVQ